MRKRICSYLFLMVSLLLTGSTCGKEKADVELANLSEQIINLERGALERWRQGDPGGFLEIIADDYTYFDPFITRRLDQYEAIEEMYETLRGQVNFDSFDIIDPKVQFEGSTAVLTFNFKSYGRLEDGTYQQRSHWHTTEVFRRFPQEWKLISTHWSFTKTQLARLAAAGVLSGDSIPVKHVAVGTIQGDVAEAVLERERAVLDRWGKGNLDGYLEIMADEYTYFDPQVDKRVDGREAMLQFLSPMRGRIRIDRDEIIEPRVQTDGRTAVLTFNHNSYLEDEGEAAKASSRWHATEIYREIDDRWKLISTHWSLTQDTLKEMAESGAWS